jgi:uridine kinase
MGQFELLLRKIGEAMTAKERTAKQRFVVAIDGRGGSGKSTLAKKLVRHIGHSFPIEFDAFHLPQSQLSSTRRFDRQRIVGELLEPFRAGEKRLRYRQYNWGYLTGSYDGVDANPVEVATARVLVLEGCNSLHSSLIEYYDFCIWLELTQQESSRRGIRRDIEEYGLDPDKVHQAWKEWGAWEEKRVAAETPAGLADFVYRQSEA